MTAIAQITGVPPFRAVIHIDFTQQIHHVGQGIQRMMRQPGIDRRGTDVVVQNADGNAHTVLCLQTVIQIHGKRKPDGGYFADAFGVSHVVPGSFPHRLFLNGVIVAAQGRLEKETDGTPLRGLHRVLVSRHPTVIKLHIALPCREPHFTEQNVRKRHGIVTAGDRHGVGLERRRRRLHIRRKTAVPDRGLLSHGHGMPVFIQNTNPHPSRRVGFPRHGHHGTRLKQRVTCKNRFEFYHIRYTVLSSSRHTSVRRRALSAIIIAYIPVHCNKKATAPDGDGCLEFPGGNITLLT